jgi:hypothetical protein
MSVSLYRRTPLWRTSVRIVQFIVHVALLSAMSLGASGCGSANKTADARNTADVSANRAQVLNQSTLVIRTHVAGASVYAASDLSLTDASDGLELEFDLKDVIQAPAAVPTGPLKLRIPRSRIVNEAVAVENAAVVAAEDVVVDKDSEIHIETTVGNGSASASGTVALVNGTLSERGEPSRKVGALIVPPSSVFNSETEARKAAHKDDTIVSTPVVRSGKRVTAFLLFGGAK